MPSAFYLDVPATHPDKSKTWDFVSSLDAGAVLIGEFSPENRTDLTSKTLGVSHALKNNNKAKEYNFWKLIKGAVQNIDVSNPVAAKNAAMKILDKVLVYPRELMTDKEILKQGSKLFWAQDIEFYPGTEDNPTSKEIAQEVYAGIIALLWAGRQVYGKSLQITPVVGSAVLQNLNPDPKSDNELGGFVDIEALLTSGDYLKQLQLNTLPKIKKDISVNLMSTLHSNGLIDGFINQDYNVKYLPGHQPIAKLDASLNTPFANQVNYTNIINTGTSRPFEIDYSGDSMPVNASIYFTTRAGAAAVKPIKNFFTPTMNNIISINASHLQDLSGSPVVDMTSLAGNQSVNLVVELSREAHYESFAGFYNVTNSNGSVYDPLTGLQILPGDPSYAGVALSSDNLTSNMSDFKLNQNGRQDIGRIVVDDVMMAPFAITTVSGKENAYFAFMDANPDGINHFKRLERNAFGFEDVYGGGDFDYNDLKISLRFMDVA